MRVTTLDRPAAELATATPESSPPIVPSSAGIPIAPMRPQPVSGDIRVSRLDVARELIESQLHRSELTPVNTAGALGISVRLLHLLFKPTGTSFARYVMSRRLERVRHLLASEPTRPIMDIALACGIESSTVFYRAFRKAFGMTPVEYRRSLSGGR